jgi:hypothetical protein
MEYFKENKQTKLLRKGDTEGRGQHAEQIHSQ